jgi:hypothetical protein
MKPIKRKPTKAESARMMAAFEKWGLENPPASAQQTVQDAAKDIARFFAEHPELGWGLDVYGDRVSFYRIVWQ